MHFSFPGDYLTVPQVIVHHESFFWPYPDSERIILLSVKHRHFALLMFLIGWHMFFFLLYFQERS